MYRSVIDKAKDDSIKQKLHVESSVLRGFTEEEKNDLTEINVLEYQLDLDKSILQSKYYADAFDIWLAFSIFYLSNPSFVFKIPT